MRFNTSNNVLVVSTNKSFVSSVIVDISNQVGTTGSVTFVETSNVASKWTSSTLFHLYIFGETHLLK